MLGEEHSALVDNGCSESRASQSVAADCLSEQRTELNFIQQSSLQCVLHGKSICVSFFTAVKKIIYLQFKGQKAYVVHGFRGSIPRLTAKQKAHGRRVWQVKVLEYMAARKQRWKE